MEQIESKKSVNKTHIYKSNSLIESSYKLSVAEQRVIYLGIKKLQPIFIEKNKSIDEIKDLLSANLFDDIEISAIEYKKEFNIKGNSVYKDLIPVIDRLYNRTIQYYDEDNRLVKKRWVITSKYDDKNNKIILRFHPDLVMDLLVFKNKYTPLKSDISKNIKNNYTYRIYELLKQYEKIGKRAFTIGDLRYKLAIPDTEYPKYANMKQKILNPSVKILNETSDINIELKELKESNKVSTLIFFIKNNKTPKKVISNDQISFDEIAIAKENSLYEQLMKLIHKNITPQECESIFDSAIEGINDCGLQIGVLDYVKEKVKVIENYSKYNRISNYVGILIDALKTNYGIQEQKQTSIFHNFEQRTYDYNKLERELLGWE